MNIVPSENSACRAASDWPSEVLMPSRLAIELMLRDSLLFEDISHWQMSPSENEGLNFWHEWENGYMVAHFTRSGAEMGVRFYTTAGQVDVRTDVARDLINQLVLSQIASQFISRAIDELDGDAWEAALEHYGDEEHSGAYESFSTTIDGVELSLYRLLEEQCGVPQCCFSRVRLPHREGDEELQVELLLNAKSTMVPLQKLLAQVKEEVL